MDKVFDKWTFARFQSVLSLAFGVCMLSFTLTACGDSSDDVAGGSAEEEGIIASETFDELPECTEERESVTAYVKKDKAGYVCKDGDWVPDTDEESSDSDEEVSSSSLSEGVDPESSESDDDISSSSQKKQNIIVINDKSITGVSQKGPFVTGSAVKLYELDGKSLAQTGKSFTGKISSDKGEFGVSSVSLASQYALLEASGYYRNEVTGNKSSGTIVLNALTDLSDREKVNVNLLTHLEYERALYLLETGINVPAAKKQAEAEVFNAFGIQGDFANSEDLSIFSSGEGDAALLAFSVLILGDNSEADLTELMNKFATDIKEDGEWTDEATKAKIADWASAKDLNGGLEIIKSNINGWSLGTAPNFEKYVRDFWYVNYGLGDCSKTREGEVAADSNTNSTNYYENSPVRYICKSGAWIEATDVEKNTFGEKCTSADVGGTMNGKVTESNKYYCTANGWVSLKDWSWDVPREARFNPNIDYDTMTDSRDGKTYRIVTIGYQVWMAENLNYDYNNGTAKSYCFNDIEANCAVTGRLYTWAAAIDSVALANDVDNPQTCGYGIQCTLPAVVQGVCPEGWHLPSNAEWQTLFSAVGGPSEAGTALKSQTGTGAVSGRDAYGFSSVPAGGRSVYGSFGYAGYAFFWSASQLYFDAYHMILNNEREDASLDYGGKDIAISVRCVQN